MQNAWNKHDGQIQSVTLSKTANNLSWLLISNNLWRKPHLPTCFVCFVLFLILPCIDAWTLKNSCTELMLWKITAACCTMKWIHSVKCICFWSHLCKHCITSQVKNVLLCFKLLKLYLDRRNYKLVCQLCFALNIHWRHVWLPAFVSFIITFLSLNHPHPHLKHRSALWHSCHNSRNSWRRHIFNSFTISSMLLFWQLVDICLSGYN